VAGQTPLLQVEALTVEYKRRPDVFRAVDRVSFDVRPGETVGLVGESGSGKTTIGNAILGLAPVAAGSIVFDGEDITHCGGRRRRALTREIQVVFQDPYGSLNPVRTVGATLAEALLVHERRLGAAVAAARVAQTLELAGMPAEAAGRYPGHFSGGQLQRIAIARALIVGPRLIVCDEPVSALDLSIQAQVLNLLAEFRERLAVSYLFISHDLAVVEHVASRVVVLYRGRVVESGTADRIANAPRHPYTAMLQAAAPVPDPVAQCQRRHAFLARYAEFAELTQPPGMTAQGRT
jgi:ABC-type glutathione transport system ATPase component